jgi:hypothetical protein
MSEASSTQSGTDEALKKLVEQAAGAVAGSQNAIGIRKAMELVGFTEEQRKNMTVKIATRLVENEKTVGAMNRKSIAVIVRGVNATHDTNLAVSTVTRYVQNGWIGESPLKRGPVGDFPKPIYKALKGSYFTYLKLEQANGKKQSSIKDLAKLVNATVNKAGHARTRDHLTRKLQRDTADEFEVGKANVVEQRRVMWTNSYNLDIWFSTWHNTLIELGFARVPTESDTDIVGELAFEDDQLRRILNMDETDGSIHDTTGQRGARPPMVFT